VDALYQASGGREYYECDRSVVITNSFFTPAASQLGKKIGTVLVDRNVLADWITEYQAS